MSLLPAGITGADGDFVDLDFAPEPIAAWLRRGLHPEPERRFLDAEVMRVAWRAAVDAVERRERTRRWWREFLAG